MSKHKQSLLRLREMMHELFDARYGGSDAARIVRAQGLADGYMRALSDMGLVKEWELLDLIDDERRKAAEKIEMRYVTPMRASETAAGAI